MRRLALIASLLAASIAGLAASAGADDARTYKIEMYNAFGIVEGSDVRIAGVNAGSVTELEVTAAKTALVTVELSGELGTLGEESTCSSEPQSLIAEYFISCEPAGEPIDSDPESDQPDIPASAVEQTVQTDLVQNTLREPFKRRLQLIINEFGTALAGNADRLNEAIRLGAPALSQLHEVTQILASQNRIIRDLNADSDQVIGRLAERREDVVRFVQEARDTAEISVSRREDLSRDFEILDDFLFELRPTLADLEGLAREQTPLLTDLRAAAPGLNTLARNLPGFNRATEASLDTLGEAAVVGDRALSRGRDEIDQLRETAKNAYPDAEMLKDLVNDLLDPRRVVEIDDRAATDTGRTSATPGTKQTKGYTAIEGLLNYAYYQTGAINQFDGLGHLLHFTLHDVESGPCSSFSSGRDPDTGEPGVPSQADPSTTTDQFLEANLCTGWLGKNQPGITEPLELAKYDPSVCPDGTEPEAAREELCDPAGSASAPARGGRGAGQGANGGDGAQGPGGGGDDGGGTGGGAGGDTGGGSTGLPGDDVLDDILDDLPADALDDLPGNLGDALQQGQGGGGGLGGGTTPGGAPGDLLDFLFAS
jgi:ABC-type transporter Mla subunit MlaD